MAELPGGGQLTHAAILGQDGGVWASSPDFPEPSEEEVAAIMKGFDDAAALAATGLRIGGEKYMVVAGEPGEAIRGKKGPGTFVARSSLYSRRSYYLIESMLLIGSDREQVV